MAKNFGKFILFTVTAAAAGAAAYYFLQKKDYALTNDDDEDYDDFSDSAEDTDTPSRTYVPLNHDVTTEAEDKDDFTPLSEQVAQAAGDTADKTVETVEEFFDDDEPDDEPFDDEPAYDAPANDDTADDAPAKDTSSDKPDKEEE